MSSAYCLLFKLFTLKLTRRQVQAMLNHVDSPYIRGLGFMYIRSARPPPSSQTLCVEESRVSQILPASVGPVGLV